MFFTVNSLCNLIKVDLTNNEVFFVFFLVSFLGNTVCKSYEHFIILITQYVLKFVYLMSFTRRSVYVSSLLSGAFY